MGHKMKLELTCNHRIARAKFALMVFALAAVPGLIGSTAFADQVIPDDVIIQGSACIGLDCVNNESFGFDTLRLKENNTRIKFEDTSTNPGFPTNDWTLVANDSASGGRNFFGIEDTTAGRMIFGVSAGAPSASLWVNSLGNVGLGTENPLLKLHLISADTPGIRLEQTNAGGFTAQTWDIGGNEANFFIRDLTGGSTLPFRIRPGAPTSSIDIASNGFVGFGTPSPTAQLHTTGTIRFEGLSGCGAGLATDAQGYLSCMVGGGSSLVQQAGPGQPITVGAATDGTQVAVNGTAGNRTLTGVLAGTVAAGSTDAINGGQLYTANQRVAAAFGGGAGLDGSGQLTAPSYTVQGTAYNNVGGAVNALDTALSSIVGGSTYVRVNGIGPGASATGTNATAIGSGSSSSGLNSIAVGTGSQATQSGSIAVGFNSSSTGLNSIAIGTGATATGSVAVGAGSVRRQWRRRLWRWRGGHRLALDRGRSERVRHRRQFRRDRLGLHQYRRQHRVVRVGRQRAAPDQCCRRHQPDRRGQCRAVAIGRRGIPVATRRPADPDQRHPHGGTRWRRTGAGGFRPSL